MSLHCPATLIVARSEADGRTLAVGLLDRRVAVVYSGPRPETALIGLVVARELGAVFATLPGLDGGPGGLPTSPEEVVSRYEEELRSLADLHRGETVLVLADAHPRAGWVGVEVVIGDDGVWLRACLDP